MTAYLVLFIHSLELSSKQFLVGLLALSGTISAAEFGSCLLTKQKVSDKRFNFIIHSFKVYSNWLMDFQNSL